MTARPNPDDGANQLIGATIHFHDFNAETRSTARCRRPSLTLFPLGDKIAPAMTPNQKTKILRQALLFVAAMLLLIHTALSESGPDVVTSQYGDKYSKLVRLLEAGETNINYSDFRNSFLESDQFKTAADERSQLDSLRKTLHDLMKNSKYPQIIDVAKKMLSIDYTDMEAHKILQQTYKIVGDAANQKKYHDIEFGLLNSIVKNGDGKTCQTAWPVIQVEEQYFILEMLGTKLLKQSIDPNGPCDRMEVQTEEGKKVYYFGISKVFKGYNKQGIH
jgi:hypothetical protein